MSYIQAMKISSTTLLMNVGVLNYTYDKSLLLFKVYLYTYVNDYI